MRRFVKKYASSKKLRYLVAIIVCSLLVIGLWLYTIDFPQTLENFYFNILNPRAGAIQLEREYKTSFDNADQEETNINLTIDEIKQRSLQSNDTQTATDFYTKFAVILNDEFNNRNADYQEMFHIDDESSKLNLPDAYQEFYYFRKKADVNDYAGFKTYRQGTEELMDGSIAYYTLEAQYHAVLKQMFPTQRGLFSDKNNEAILVQLAKFDMDFNEIKLLKKKGVYTDKFYGMLANEFMRTGLFRQLYVATRNKDNNTIADVENKIIQTNDLVPSQDDEVQIYLDWVKTKIQPFYTSQNEIHNASFAMYDITYKFAKDKKLNDILTIWENHPPGTSLSINAL